MMAGVEARGRTVAARAVARAKARVAAALAAVPGVTPEIVDDGIIAQGERLKARWLDDARLRWLGGWM